MAGIYVLSDTLKGGNKLEKTSTPKGKDMGGSPENAAAVFAALLSGSMNPNADPKGQNSSGAGQKSEKSQSTDKPVQNLQKGQGSMLGFGNLALSFLTQPMLQSELPAGKEANSGNAVSQGTGGLATPNAAIVSSNNLELAMLKPFSLTANEVSAPSGMTTPQSQGANPEITELDKYRKVIGDLLLSLSGEITDISPQETSLGSESAGTNNLSQVLAKVVQGWTTATGDVAQGNTVLSGQAIPLNSSGSEVLNRLAALLKELKSPQEAPASSESVGTTNLSPEMVKVVQAGTTTVTGDVAQGNTVLSSQVTPLSSSGSEVVNQLAALLEELKSPQQAPISSGSAGTTNPSLELAKVIQTGAAVTGDVAQGNGVLSSQVTPLNSAGSEVVNQLAALLEELKSPQQAPVSSESAGTTNLSPELVKVIQAGAAVTGDVAQGNTVLSSQAVPLNSAGTQVVNFLETLLEDVKALKESPVSLGSAGTDNLSQSMAKLVQDSSDSGLNVKVATFLEALYPLLSQGSGGVGIAKSTQEMKATMSVESDPSDQIYTLDPKSEEGLNPLMKAMKGTDLNPAVTQLKDTALFADTQQKPGEMSSTGTISAKVLQGTLNQEVPKIEDAKSGVSSGTNDVQNQNSSAGVVVASNTLSVNAADGKTVALPVWEQVSTVVREQILNKSQDLKQLDIQLHPADLGKIQIDLHWENGQVHLQVQASEAATGQILQSHLSDLRQSLSDQGVNCGMLQMGQGGGHQNNPNGDDSRRTSAQNTLSNQEEDAVPAVVPFSVGQEGTYQINITA
jgi:flagellar hook-length control protein FliK